MQIQAVPWRRILLVVCLAVVCGAGPLVVPTAATEPAVRAPQEPAQEENPKQDPELEQQSYNVSLKGFEDSGTYFLYMKGSLLGTIEYDRKADGRIRNLFTISMAGQTLEVATTIAVDDNGMWRKIETRSAQGDADIERKGLVLERTIVGRKSTLEIGPDCLLYDNNIPGLLSDVVRAFHAAGKEEARIPLLSPVTATFTAKVSPQGEVERAIAGRDMIFEKYIMALPGVDTTLYADARGTVYLYDIPQQLAYFVRQGYEALAVKAIDDPLLSKPELEARVQKDVMVAMRDEVGLATDLYRPVTDRRVPLVLIRTPYGKDMMEMEGNYWARRGYACAIQDCRGRFKSKGVWTPFMHEAEDGYDTIEAIAAKAWCTGKVGMIGGSYVGWVQWWAASQNPPHLVTIVPNVSPPDPHYNIPFEYGTFFLLGSIWWAKILETGATADLTGGSMRAINEADYTKLLHTLPVIDLDKAFLGSENRYWRSWIEHSEDKPFWEKSSFLEKLQRVNIPVFHQSGWFDGDAIGSKLNYLEMSSCGHGHQKMIIGPWGHTDTASRLIGSRDFTKTAVIDLQREYLRWFDFWLKEIDNRILDEPLVKMFTMGSNEWHSGDTYPLETTVFKKLYLASDSGAATNKGDGRLTWEAGVGQSEADTFVYDPGDPTPDPGFYPTTSKEEREKETLSVVEEERKQKAFHRQITDEREDILVFRTEPLEEPLTICGPLSALLYASTSARDTDWFVTLSEESRKGKIFVLASGKVRARYRKTPFVSELLEPGKVYEYGLDLWHTGITFPKGSRVRVEVSSAQFPTFSRNLNTGGHNEMETEFEAATQKIFHSAEYPSHVLLPVLEED